MNETKRLADRNLIFECVAGSKLVGANLDNADDDRLGVCVEPPEWVIGLRRFEQLVDRSAPDGERSGEGDYDRTIYSLRKFASLAVGGNPTILQLLFVPQELTIASSGIWQQWQDNAHLFASRQAGKAFLGYMTQQRQRLEEGRAMRVNRPELVEAHGYDTKYAYHVVRLGEQGREFLRTGRLTLPMSPMERAYLRGVRMGEIPLLQVMNYVDALTSDLEELVHGASPLPEKPDYDAVNRLLVKSYRRMYFLTRWDDA